MSVFDKIHNLFPESNEFSSLPVEAFNSLKQKYSLTNYLSLSVYDERNAIFHHNDGYYGLMFEVSPRLHASGQTSQAMVELLNKMPQDVFLQISYMGSKNISGQMNEYKRTHSLRFKDENGKILEESINEFASFIESKKSESCSSTMTSKLKTVRLFFSLTSKRFKTLRRYQRDLENILISNNFNPIKMNPQAVIEVAYELLNPNVKEVDYPIYDNTLPINKQCVNRNTSFLANDDYFQIGNSRSWVNMTPQSLSQYFHISEFGAKLGDYIGESLNVNQFQDAFIVSATITRKTKRASNSASRNHSLIMGQNWSEAFFRVFANVKKESIKILDRIDEKNESLFEFDLDVLVSGECPAEAERNAQIVESYWGKSNGGYSKIKLEKTRGIHHIAFLSALPMSMTSDYFHEFGGKYRTMFADQASHFFPLEADYRGLGFNLPLITRRSNLAFLDLFKSPSNYNGYVVAKSGVGKSVFLQMQCFNAYCRGEKVFVLDYDNSFSGLVEAVDGQYLNLSPENECISFNPFSSIDTMNKLDEELQYLSSFIYLLGCSKNSQRASEDEKLIKTELQNIIKIQYEINSSELEITHIRDHIMKEFEEKDNRFVDFARQLGQYCKNGIYEKWFCGKCQFTMEKDFVAVEFKGVENHEDLRDPLIMLLLYHIGSEMYSTDANKAKINIVLDEAHRFMGKNERMDDFIDQAYRRARKFRASIIIATQGFTDIYSEEGGLSKAGKSIIMNSAWKFFLEQESTSVEIMLNSGTFSFTEHEKRMLKSVKTRKGEYSEIFCISSEDQKTIFRLIMPRFFYYLTTTDPDDKNKIHNYMMEHNLSKELAIKEIIKDEIKK